MSNFELIASMLVLTIVALVLIAPALILRTKGNRRNGEKALSSIMGTMLSRISGSMVPTHRFNIFSDGLLICSIFSERFIPKAEIKRVNKARMNMRPYLEIELESGDTLRVVTANNRRLIDWINGEATNQRL